jgi:hypothetical protein
MLRNLFGVGRQREIRAQTTEWALYMLRAPFDASPCRKEARQVHRVLVCHVACFRLLSRRCRRACCVLPPRSLRRNLAHGNGQKLEHQRACHAAALVCSLGVILVVLGSSLCLSRARRSSASLCAPFDSNFNPSAVSGEIFSGNLPFGSCAHSMELAAKSCNAYSKQIRVIAVSGFWLAVVCKSARTSSYINTPQAQSRTPPTPLNSPRLLGMRAVRYRATSSTVWI